MSSSVLLDTSFLIRLLNDEDPLHQNAKDYYKYFLEKGIVLKLSTVSVAEYCVKGSISDLPLKNLQIIPFNLDHASRTADFARIIFKGSKASDVTLHPRAIIPNDSKLFASADLDKTITHFVTSDERSKSTYALLKRGTQPKFEIIDIHNSYNDVFGILI
jgi:predicted nucleic acid-binding protein